MSNHRLLTLTFVRLDMDFGVSYEHVSKEQARRTEPQEIFDTHKFGKSNEGHTFPEALTRDEKR